MIYICYDQSETNCLYNIIRDITFKKSFVFITVYTRKPLTQASDWAAKTVESSLVSFNVIIPIVYL